MRLVPKSFSIGSQIPERKKQKNLNCERDQSPLSTSPSVACRRRSWFFLSRSTPPLLPPSLPLLFFFFLQFHLSFPYAGAIATAGILAWANKKSHESLVFCGVFSSILCFAALRSLSAYDRGETSRAATAVSLAVAVVLTIGMGKHYVDTGKSYPSLWVAAPSAFMALFYVWCLSRPALKGGKGKKAAPKKKAIAAAPAGSPPKRMTRAAAASKKRA